ncbi:MAG: glycosyltransferase family 2 protein [Ferruginibacter sp.]|nr:glycosyltransferase family 2 protein [Ferruginibacter sp.]
MRISGFTIIKNAILNDYPVAEAICSILPMVDEMIVLIGDCKDDTVQLIEGIASPKIKIHHSVWDTVTHTNGTVLAAETNKAFNLVDASSDWAFYIQADEAVHEQYHKIIEQACGQYKSDKRVEGLLFKYLHFYGTYDFTGDSRKWYANEVRVIRNDKKITSYRDAQGFRVGERKLNVKMIDAYIYHYGWVRSVETIRAKNIHVAEVWHRDIALEKYKLSDMDYNFENFDSLVLFTGTHPAVYKKRIKEKNWHLELDISKKHFSFKNKLLYYVEKLTGKRLFNFRNYKIIR